MFSSQTGYRRDKEGNKESRLHAKTRVILRKAFRQAAVVAVGVLAAGATLYGAHLAVDNNQLIEGVGVIFSALSVAGIAVASLSSCIASDRESLFAIREDIQNFPAPKASSPNLYLRAFQALKITS